MAMARGDCTYERWEVDERNKEQEKESKSEREREVCAGIREHRDAKHYFLSHVSNRITAVRQADCIQISFLFHHVLIRANLLCLFGNGKSRSKQCGEKHVCIPLTTAIFSNPCETYGNY